jgi:hypothetical protein
MLPFDGQLPFPNTPQQVFFLIGGNFIHNFVGDFSFHLFRKVFPVGKFFFQLFSYRQLDILVGHEKPPYFDRYFFGRNHQSL